MLSFWAQKILKWINFLFKWIFLVSIELLHDPKLVQIVSFFFYWPEFLKKYLEQKLMKCVSFWHQKLTHNVSFWGQKPTDPFSRFLGPETDKKITISGARNSENGSVIFLGPETTDIVTT
jgi:hypothetical protein